jgi:hypothetical protein
MGRARRNLGHLTALGGAILLFGGCTVLVPLPGRVDDADGGSTPISDIDADVPDLGVSPQRDARPVDAGSDALDDSDGGYCWPMPVPHVLVPPQVIVAFDRSATMTTRVEAIRKELTPALGDLDGAVSFGYIEFPDKACDPSMGCCLASNILIPPALGTGAAIGKALACDANGRKCVEGPPRTPSNDALGKIQVYFRASPSGEAERFVVMITDGAPNCGGIGDPCTDARLIARDLWQSQLSVKTAILAISPEARFSCLSRVAEAGGDVFFRSTTTMGLPFVYVDDVIPPNDVKGAIAQVLAPVKARSCVVRLAGSRDHPEDVTVRANGAAVNYDATHADGWDFDDHNGRQIHIYGPKCTQLQMGQIKPANVQATVVCTACGDRIDCSSHPTTHKP